jgi:hypothetical protein
MAQSRHPDRVGECPLSEVKRTLQFQCGMSAYDPTQTSVAKSRFTSQIFPTAARGCSNFNNLRKATAGRAVTN